MLATFHQAGLRKPLRRIRRRRHALIAGVVDDVRPGLGLVRTEHAGGQRHLAVGESFIKC